MFLVSFCLIIYQKISQMSRNIVVEDEQTLPIPQLKTVIIKSLNILIAKLSNNDSDQQTDIVPD